MKSSLLTKALNVLQFVSLILLPAVMYAPPIPPGPGSTTPSPIDGGLVFLLIAGVTYGIKRLVDMRKQIA